MIGMCLVLAGCASFSPDQGIAPIGDMATGALGKEVIKVRSEGASRDAPTSTLLGSTEHDFERLCDDNIRPSLQARVGKVSTSTP